MTSERRLVIEPQDIQGIEFVCRACGASLGLNAAQERHFVKTECPNCGSEWLPYDSVLHKAASSLFRSLGTLTQMRGEAKFIIGMHVNMDESVKPAKD